MSFPITSLLKQKNYTGFKDINARLHNLNSSVSFVEMSWILVAFLVSTFTVVQLYVPIIYIDIMSGYTYQLYIQISCRSNPWRGTSIDSLDFSCSVRFQFCILTYVRFVMIMRRIWKEEMLTEKICKTGVCLLRGKT